MIAYRIGSSRYPANDGEGARLYGGRWNNKGIAVVYAAQSMSLCALEVLANSSRLPAGCMAIEIRIPDALPLSQAAISSLPKGWDNPRPTDHTRNVGTKWAIARTTAILVVPSSIIPSERNYLLNPNHPDFLRIQFGSPRPFFFDSRLK